ncbi:YgfZ/GcvT domain-containing protein [Hoeflea poritis]|uniref:Folate-binding protein YgfZ n=1 Tax=Hoeflea poritis TaxID=2993659 RepID=A0ABT4VQD3_9HYPH|nr:folate-binding protein YgfZ [Hoeflea poritis]MDA4846901.1 folate-binding protein YgfZ [Hoeflea poritis]
MHCAALTDRALVGISGDDAQMLLQDVISCEVENLPDGVARPGALLTPQGKILFEFLISRDGADRFLLDLPRAKVGGFVQRMMMYRLRAKAEIAPVDDVSVHAAWGGEQQDGWLLDDRFRNEANVYRIYGASPSQTASHEDYDHLRVENGVAEAGADYALSDAFPHDISFDLNGGVSFKKGCFVGQEVVSRMQHRSTARRRVVIVEGQAPLPETGSSLTAGGRAVGLLGTVAGNRGLALVRIDKVAAARDSNTPLLAGDVPVEATLPAWTGLSFPTADAAGEA